MLKQNTFSVCICNEGYEVSLELGKPYETLPGPDAGELGQIRIIDESGEDYLYPKKYFVVGRDLCPD